jgi:hypothetical protein
MCELSLNALEVSCESYVGAYGNLDRETFGYKIYEDGLKMCIEFEVGSAACYTFRIRKGVLH